MDYHLASNGCWRAEMGPIRMGSRLDLESLGAMGLEVRALKQVHGVDIRDDAYFSKERAYHEGDGLVSLRSGVALVVKTADCLPVILSDGHKIAAVHAGWRGFRAGIVERLTEHFDMARVFAFIGPAISADNYEVDRDLYQAWLAEDPELASRLKPAPAGGTKRLFDLKGMAHAQLTRLGVSEDRLEVIPVCTVTSPLPSFRRDKNRDRSIYSYVYRVAEGTHSL